MSAHLPPVTLPPVFAVSCGLSLLLVLTLLQGFFYRFSGFPSSIETNTSKFQFDLDIDLGSSLLGPWLLLATLSK